MLTPKIFLKGIRVRPLYLYALKTLLGFAYALSFHVIIHGDIKFCTIKFYMQVLSLLNHFGWNSFRGNCKLMGWLCSGGNLLAKCCDSIYIILHAELVPLKNLSPHFSLFYRAIQAPLPKAIFSSHTASFLLGLESLTQYCPYSFNTCA